MGGLFPFTKDFLAHVKFSPENAGLERSICGPVEILGWPKSLGVSNELFGQPRKCPHWRKQPVDQRWLCHLGWRVPIDPRAAEASQGLRMPRLQVARTYTVKGG